MGERTVAVDVGGTKVAAGLVDADGGLSAQRRRPTPVGDGAALVEAIWALVAELGAPGAALGVGVAGFVDLDGVVRTSPNLPGLVDEPLARRLAARWPGSVRVVNDADAAAWGEFRTGAGRDAASLAMLTVGTGVGGGLVLGGRLVRGAHGAAGELGHVVVDEGGPRCPCGNHGCLEAHASGTALARKARERHRAGTMTAGSPLAGEDVAGEDVTAAAAAGDPDGVALLADAGFWLGVGMAGITNAFDPAVIVVGGGLAAAGDLLLEPARQACAARVLGASRRTLPPVVLGELGAHAGLVGAGLLADADQIV